MILIGIYHEFGQSLTPFFPNSTNFLQFFWTFSQFAFGHQIFEFYFYFQHPFIANATDPKPILDLLAEFKAEIIEEEIADVHDDKSDQVNYFFPLRENRKLYEQSTKDSFQKKILDIIDHCNNFPYFFLPLVQLNKYETAICFC